MNKDRISADEFRRLAGIGALQSKGERVKYDPPVKEVETMLQSEEEERRVLHLYGYTSQNSIYVPGEVRSSKNSKRIFKKNVPKSSWRYNGRPVLPFITDSKAAEAYKKATNAIYKQKASRFRHMTADKPLPYRIELLFLRKTESSFDFNNISQVIQDQMQNHGWVKDDNVKNVLPYPCNPAYYKDPENAGVIIKIL